MMTKTTPQNYTPEQTLELVAGYQAGETVETLAARLGKTTRSVVSKLSREGVYVAKAKPSNPRVTKAVLVEQLAVRCGVPVEVFDSLEKANHDVLEALVYNMQWSLQLRVKKFSLDLQPQFWYNNILEINKEPNREWLNEYHVIVSTGASSAQAAHLTKQQLDCNYLCG